MFTFLNRGATLDLGWFHILQFLWIVFIARVKLLWRFGRNFVQGRSHCDESLTKPGWLLFPTDSCCDSLQLCFFCSFLHITMEDSGAIIFWWNSFLSQPIICLELIAYLFLAQKFLNFIWSFGGHCFWPSKPDFFLAKSDIWIPVIGKFPKFHQFFLTPTLIDAPKYPFCSVF